MRRLNPRRASDAGETLIELTLAITLMAGAGLVFATALATAVKGAARMQGQADAGTVVASAAQTLASEAKVPFNNSGCSSSAAKTTYQGALTALTPQGFTTTVTDVKFWETGSFTSSPSSCSAVRLQRVTLQTVAPDGATEQVAVAKQRILGAPWLSGAQAATGQPSNSTLSDSVTVNGVTSPSAQVAFKLYPLGCEGTAVTPVPPVLAGTNVTVSGGNARITLVQLPVTGPGGVPLAAGTYGWETTTPLSAGTYEWRATYLGDADNGPATTGCPATTTSGDHQQFLLPTFAATAPLPGSTPATPTMAYTVTLTTTGPNPSTTPSAPTFTLSYYPTSACTSGTSVGTTGPLSWNPTAGTYSQSSGPVNVPGTPGDYYLGASYSGDQKYAPSPLSCGHLLHVDSLTAALSGTVATGLTATATLANPSGPITPTGMITFTAFPDPGGCTGSTVSPPGPVSAPVTSTGGSGGPGANALFGLSTSGTYWLQTLYSGDGNNAPAASCVMVTV